MRFYGNKYIKNKVTQVTEYHSETKDAILWDIDHVKRTCTVKIQGSDNRITTRFPSNWTTTPSWMKPGNSVRVLHKGGVRGRIEIVGDGLVIPTAITGGTQTPPVIDLGLDSVLSGCRVLAIPD